MLLPVLENEAGPWDVGPSGGSMGARSRGESISSAFLLRWLDVAWSSVTGLRTEGKVTERGTEGDTGVLTRGGSSSPLGGRSSGPCLCEAGEVVVDPG